MKIKYIYITICALVLSAIAVFVLYKTPTPPTVLHVENNVPQISEVPPTVSAAQQDEITPTGSPSPTVSPSVSQKPTLKAQALVPQKPTSVTATSGSIKTLNYISLQAKTLYAIDLSSYSFDSFVISWPKGIKLTWAQKAPITLSDLTALEADEDELPTDTKSFSGIIARNNVQTIYLESDKDVATLSFSLLSPDTQSVNSYSIQAAAGIYDPTAGASYSSLPIVSRSTWGANPSSWDSNTSAHINDESRLVWYPVYYKAARIVVHHTATAPNTSNPAAAVRSIYLYHAYIRDWGDIGYNFLIDQNGTIYQGKLGGDEAMGYHASGSANQTSIGISLIGDFTSTTPGSSTRTSLVKLIAEKAAFYGFSLKYSTGGVSKWKDPSYTVFGHRSSYHWESDISNWDVNNTACPGNAFFPQLPTVVQEAETYRQNNFAEIKEVVAKVTESFTTTHDQGVIVVQYNVPEDTDEATIQSYLPKFSGITDYTIEGNTVTIPIASLIVVHPEYGDSEYLVPPMAWSGYYNEFATYTPSYSMNGPEDRAKTLLKIFKLDSRVSAADVKSYFEIAQPSQSPIPGN